MNLYFKLVFMLQSHMPLQFKHDPYIGVSERESVCVFCA
uniref:Uncharacterized protein n=1 Tax=Anguilla anguilla TaxID=7936 RepID=A0A0E9VFF7_ANGAN